MLNTSIKLILIDGKHREKVLKILTSVLDDVFKIQNTDLNHNYCRCKLEKNVDSRLFSDAITLASF